MFTIENNQLKVSIQAQGAELASILNKENKLEYLWDGNPQFWPKQSPILFPIVGSLKDNTYFYKGQSYQIPTRHGFAREKVFSVKEQTQDSVTFSINEDEETLKAFPFSFEFSITYTLKENTLSVRYSVRNKGNEEMYFSVGGHPAFNVPLVAGTTYEDYELKFNQKETAPTWPNTNGLFQASPVPFFDNQDMLPLSKELLKTNTLQFKHLKSNEITLRSALTPHGVSVNLTGFPYLCIWAAPDADFICIEPWCGISDGVNSNQQWEQKEGNNQLPAGETFERSWSATFF